MRDGLIGMHQFSVCDSTSRFAGHGKNPIAHLHIFLQMSLTCKPIILLQISLADTNMNWDI